MDDQQLDLNSLNEIDMECNVCDDDDDFVIKPSFQATNSYNNRNKWDVEEGSEERDYNAVTGIIIDLSDDDDVKVNKIKTITANIEPETNEIKIDRNFESNNNFNLPSNSFEDTGEYNVVDMECNSCEDDDYDFIPSKKKNTLLDFSDDEDYNFDNKEFVDEDMLKENKPKATSQGKVETDYWNKLQKKHEATNKKGAYNTLFHLSKDSEPKMTSDIPTPTTIASTSNVTSSSVGSADGGCSESLNEDLDRIFSIIGFEVIPNSDGSYTALDTCDSLDDIECANMVELLNSLKPYIDDCFIYPLQIATGQKFVNCDEWVNWYNEQNQKQYPNCKDDIDCCKIIIKYLN